MVWIGLHVNAYLVPTHLRHCLQVFQCQVSVSCQYCCFRRWAAQFLSGPRNLNLQQQDDELGETVLLQGEFPLVLGFIEWIYTNLIASWLNTMRCRSKIRGLHSGPGNCWCWLGRYSTRVTCHNHLHIPPGKTVGSFCGCDQCLWPCGLLRSCFGRDFDGSHKLAMVLLDVSSP